MILELAAITLTTKALIAIICGSLAGGMAVGGAAGYLAMRASDGSNPETEQEYHSINDESARREKQRQRSLKSTTHHVSLVTEELVEGFSENQKRASSSISQLQQSINLAERHHETGFVILDETKQENAIIKQLMSELKIKTDALTKLTGDYKNLQEKLTQAVNKLEETIAELDIIKKTLVLVSGEKDYTSHVIDVIKRMKSTNSEIQKSLEKQTDKYQKAEQRIVSLTQHLKQAKLTIQEQGEIIASVQNESLKEVHEIEKNSTSNIRFF